ncbi:hypothetical protein Hanom_Chr05g00470791 [Helianthus anomalus]
MGSDPCTASQSCLQLPNPNHVKGGTMSGLGGLLFVWSDWVERLMDQNCLLYLVLHPHSSHLVQIFLTQVMRLKAIGIALKLTLSGMNQLVYP